MDRKPPYVQIADTLRAELEAGDHGQPGDALPAQPHLADRFGVSLGTLKRAMALLAQEGLLTASSGERARVAGAPRLAGGQLSIRELLDDVSRRLAAVEQRLGM